jgi:hypothetical protein
MSASDNPVPEGKPHKVQLRAAYEGTITDPSGIRMPSGSERLLLMVTTVFDRLTEADEPVTDPDV